MPYHNWDDGHLSWQNVSNVLLKNGFDNGLFNIKVKPDFQSFKSNVIYVRILCLYMQNIIRTIFSNRFSITYVLCRYRFVQKRIIEVAKAIIYLQIKTRTQMLQILQIFRHRSKLIKADTDW